MNIKNIGISVNQFIVVEKSIDLNFLESRFDNFIIHYNKAFNISTILDISALNITINNLTFINTWCHICENGII